MTATRMRHRAGIDDSIERTRLPQAFGACSTQRAKGGMS
jgi:hypothetical protein